MRVLIVDDHPVTRMGLKLLLSEFDSSIHIVEAGNLAGATEAATRGESFDLVLLDVRLPDGNGIERLQRIKDAFEAAPIIVMSAEKDPDLIRKAIDAGASGYIPKETDSEVTKNAWRLVLGSGVYLPPEVLSRQSKTVSSGAPGDEHQTQPVLTERQLAVLQRLLHGNSNKVIAKQLEISEGAVKMHLAHIFDKLDVSTRTQAMAKAQELGYFEKFAKLGR